MKNYIVLRTNGDTVTFASVTFTTDSKDDAFGYAEIMNRNDPEHQYSVLCQCTK